tara:strand:+ start:23 stop:409 length:387 start_codon:yes stop_codon:yes gene_type:complete
MAHFVELDENNIVLQVVVVDDAHEADGENWCRGFFGTDRWKQTSYNTRGGIHRTINSDTPDDGVALRKNYAGIGFNYNPTLDAFVPSKPFNSWILDEDACEWRPPIPYPNDGNEYSWNESTQSWDAVE